MIYLQLFFEFFKTGLFAVGGGLATLPFLYDISAKYGKYYMCLQINPCNFELSFFIDAPEDEWESFPLESKEQMYSVIKETINKLN